MRTDKFELEYWLNPLDPLCKYNLGASCVKALGLREMLEYVGEDADAVIEELSNKSLHYGEFDGSKRLKKAIAGIYRETDPELVITTHGGTGANNMVLTELLEPGDNSETRKYTKESLTADLSIPSAEVLSMNSWQQLRWSIQMFSSKEAVKLSDPIRLISINGWRIIHDFTTVAKASALLL